MLGGELEDVGGRETLVALETEEPDGSEVFLVVGRTDLHQRIQSQPVLCTLVQN